MLPTFDVVGDQVLLSKHYRRGRDIQVGDIVSFDSVVDPRVRVIKRVLGLEGDYVLRDTPEKNDDMIQVSLCFICNRKVKKGANTTQVPEGHCWVVGDNLEYSRDSRHFGPMPMALIRGKVVAKVFPWKERRWIENDIQPVDSRLD
jgi:inner membrane protease subunit 1